jgi:hypothetical protein
MSQYICKMGLVEVASEDILAQGRDTLGKVNDMSVQSIAWHSAGHFD